MQKRWKLDQYLSYLSAPPLLCCCSSLWSPERWRQATRNGWTHRKKGGESQTGSLECGWSELWSDTFGHFTHTDTQTTWQTRRMDGRLPPRSTNQPGRQNQSSELRLLRWSFPRENPEKSQIEGRVCVAGELNLVLNRPIYAMVSNIYNKNHDPCLVLQLIG